MPPASPTTTASTTTPKASRRALTPAIPPLSPNTNVPARLRTSRSVGSKLLRATSTVSTSGSTPSHAAAPASSVPTPVSRVGWITGANRGLWLVGKLGERPASSASRRSPGRCRRRSRTPTARSTPCRRSRSPRWPDGPAMSTHALVPEVRCGTRSPPCAVAAASLRVSGYRCPARDLRQLRARRKLRLRLDDPPDRLRVRGHARPRRRCARSA